MTIEPTKPNHEMVGHAVNFLTKLMPGFADRYHGPDELGREIGDLLVRSLPADQSGAIGRAAIAAADYLHREFSRLD